jgi:hypothetical protein
VLLLLLLLLLLLTRHVIQNNWRRQRSHDERKNALVQVPPRISACIVR